MKDKQLSGVIRALIVLCVLLAVAIAILAALLLIQPAAPKQQPTAAPAPTEQGLMQAVDLEPDRTKLFMMYDGVLNDGEGRAVQLSSLRGQPVMLLFWSSWCGDCKEYMQGAFNEAAQAAENAGVKLLLVCREGVRGDDYAQASEKLRTFNIQRDTLMDPQAALFQTLGLHSVPSLAVLDADGQLVLTTADMPDAVRMQSIAAYVSQGALPQLDAFARSLMDEDGAVASAYSIRQNAIEPGDTVLSETQGLIMCYAVRVQDKALFDKAWGYVRSTMLQDGLLAWQTVKGKPGGVNASLDDLRIADALYTADKLWGGYHEDAALLTHSLFTGSVRDQLLRDFTELATGQVSQQVTLCYQHPAAMRRIAVMDVRWNSAAERAEELLRNGIISDAFPLYWPRYDTAGSAYTGQSLHMAETMVTVLHAAEAGIVDDRTLDWLETRLRQGPLYASYDTDGEVTPGYRYESTAIYALIAQVGQAANRPELTRLALARMERLRCFDQPLNGGYGRVSDRSFYAYDTVQALLAWQGMHQ